MSHIILRAWTFLFKHNSQKKKTFVISQIPVLLSVVWSQFWFQFRLQHWNHLLFILLGLFEIHILCMNVIKFKPLAEWLLCLIFLWFISWLAMFDHYILSSFFISIIIQVRATNPNYRNRLSVPLEHGHWGNCGKGVVLSTANVSLEYYRQFWGS